MKNKTLFNFTLVVALVSLSSALNAAEDESPIVKGTLVLRTQDTAGGKRAFVTSATQEDVALLNSQLVLQSKVGDHLIGVEIQTDNPENAYGRRREWAKDGLPNQDVIFSHLPATFFGEANEEEGPSAFDFSIALKGDEKTYVLSVDDAHAKALTAISARITRRKERSESISSLGRLTPGPTSPKTVKE